VFPIVSAWVGKVICTCYILFGALQTLLQLVACTVVLDLKHWPRPIDITQP